MGFIRILHLHDLLVLINTFQLVFYGSTRDSELIFYDSTRDLLSNYNYPRILGIYAMG